MEIRSEQIRSALDSNPTLTLLKAYSRDWVLPLFAESLEQVEGSVSAEWFHERVSEARDHARERQNDATPAERCRDWVEKRWLETETLNGRLRYRLSPYSLRVEGDLLGHPPVLVDGERPVRGPVNPVEGIGAPRTGQCWPRLPLFGLHPDQGDQVPDVPAPGAVALNGQQRARRHTDGSRPTVLFPSWGP